MPKKSKYNPSGKPVLTKSKNNKGYLTKSLQQFKKRIDRFRLK